MSNSNLYIKSFKVNEEHQAIANLTTNEPVEDTVNINGVEYSVGGSGASTLYCWKSDPEGSLWFDVYYYTTSENPSVGDTIYEYLNYIDGSGSPTMTPLIKNTRTVLELTADGFKAGYSFLGEEEEECEFIRYSDGDIEL